MTSVVRTHSEETERRRLKELGIGLVLMAERELAFGMMHYALRGLGVPEADARAFVDVSRAEEDPREQPAEPELERESTPELRSDGPIRPSRTRRGILLLGWRLDCCPRSRWQRADRPARFSDRLARAVGFEPTTNRLTADCSTAELRPNRPTAVVTAGAPI